MDKSSELRQTNHRNVNQNKKQLIQSISEYVIKNPFTVLTWFDRIGHSVRMHSMAYMPCCFCMGKF